MIFVKTDELKPGMRLAKPIYNRNGVLLYDRDTKLTIPGIASIQNFGLIGIYILEPAEPLPPLTREDLEFEQNQTIYLFQLQEIYDQLLSRKKPEKLPVILADIERKYGSLDHRLNFNQNLRSADDFVYKRSISIALLIALMTAHLDITEHNRQALITAALLFSIGYRNVPAPILKKGTELDQGDRDTILSFLERGVEILEMQRDNFAFMPQAIKIVRFYIFSQDPTKKPNPDPEMKMLTEMLHVASNFDQMTAMGFGHVPDSDLMAMRYLKLEPAEYNQSYVEVLAECIHIVPHAASLDLNTGEKAIVLIENPTDYLHPVILRLSNHKIYDLSDPEAAKELQIVDIMKTMDNRIKVDTETIKQFVPDKRLRELKLESQKNFGKK